MSARRLVSLALLALGVGLLPRALVLTALDVLRGP
jgi:hypothetical protein